MKPEDREVWNEINEIFDIAWDLQINKNQPTELSAKVLRYFPDIMQQYSYLCDTVEEVEQQKKDYRKR